MKSKWLNLSLIISSLFGYLEWGHGNKMFLFQGEYDIFIKLFREPGSVLHPFVLVPLLGQLFLLVTLFQKQPNRILTYLGIGCIGLLVGFMLVIGILSDNIKIAMSTMPFVIVLIIVVRSFWEKVNEL